jgi:hypothetical protein
MAVCRNLSKCLLAIVNVFFLLIGIGLIILGSFMFAKYARYGEDLLETIGTALLPTLILVVVGIMALILGILGCIATFKGQKCVTGLFFTLLLLIFVGLIAGGVLSYVYSKNIEKTVNDALLRGLEKYFSSMEIKAEIDDMQSQGHCCGVNNYTDWKDTTWYLNQSDPTHSYPESCCVDRNCTYNTTDDARLYQESCYHKLLTTVKDHLVVVGSIAGGFALILIIGMILSCVLILGRRRRPQEVPYIGLPDPDGMRV